MGNMCIFSKAKYWSHPEKEKSFPKEASTCIYQCIIKRKCQSLPKTANHMLTHGEDDKAISHSLEHRISV